jgi:hypothetical protein
MLRNYSQGINEGVRLFVGKEIENTPARDMKTLFVVGLHSAADILEMAEQHQCDHIYFGANQSFKSHGVTDFKTWDAWENMIETCLNSGFWCSLDLDVGEVEGLTESGLCEYPRFIPQISVKIPYLQQLGYNATIKIDDAGFQYSNPGVWCSPLIDLLKRENFTNWDLYSKDIIIK